MNPANGLCLNAIHDKAFDKGLITVTPDFHIKLSNKLLDPKNSNYSVFFQDYENKQITLPQKFYPSREFLEYHNKKIFQGTVT